MAAHAHVFSPPDEEGFVYVQRKGRGRPPAKAAAAAKPATASPTVAVAPVLPEEPPRGPPLSALTPSWWLGLERRTARLRDSPFFAALYTHTRRALLRMRRSAGAACVHVDLLSLGLGNFFDTRASATQLAGLLLLRQGLRQGLPRDPRLIRAPSVSHERAHPDSRASTEDRRGWDVGPRCEAFDPAFFDIEREVLTRLHITPTEAPTPSAVAPATDGTVRRPVGEVDPALGPPLAVAPADPAPEAPVRFLLVYLPHAPLVVHEAVLQANAEHLSRTLLLGNSLRSYVEHSPRTEPERSVFLRKSRAVRTLVARLDGDAADAAAHAGKSSTGGRRAAARARRTRDRAPKPTSEEGDCSCCDHDASRTGVEGGRGGGAAGGGAVSSGSDAGSSSSEQLAMRLRAAVYCEVELFSDGRVSERRSSSASTNHEGVEEEGEEEEEERGGRRGVEGGSREVESLTEALGALVGVSASALPAWVEEVDETIPLAFNRVSYVRRVPGTMESCAPHSLFETATLRSLVDCSFRLLPLLLLFLLLVLRRPVTHRVMSFV